MKSLMLLWIQLLNDCGSWCRTSTARDQKTAASRFEHEGLPFFTLALPAYASDFEQALDTGQVTPFLFSTFKKRGALPIFLGEFMDLVFDRTSGTLVDEPDHQAIACIRQLTLFLGKVELPCSDARVQRSIQGFVDCEKELKDSPISPGLLTEFGSMARLAFAQLLTELDDRVYNNDLVPKHGPGKTADRLLGNRKFDSMAWTWRLERVFPFVDYALPNHRYHELQDTVRFLEPGEELPVRVTLVPKTLKAPRVIAIEPACMQYVQQAIAVPLVKALEAKCLEDRSNNPVFGLIGFTDQTPNQRLAREGSLTGELATLDLSEASDRVSNQLVEEMLRNHPWLAMGVDACRSRSAELPDGLGIIELSKFASMGSALCFPIEAMVFLAIVLLGIQDGSSEPLTRSDISKLRGKVRVYGDDIIVPVDYVHHVIARLEAFGLRVNERKSFWTGRFRESCGGDFYAGTDVTPIRVRRELPLSRADVPEVVSAVSLRNLAYYQGFWGLAAHLDRILEGMLRHFPRVSPESPVLGRASFLGEDIQWACPHLHRPMVKGWIKRDVVPESFLGDHGALLKCLLKQGDEPFADERHLERQGRPETVGIKLGWAYSGN